LQLLVSHLVQVILKPFFHFQVILKPIFIGDRISVVSWCRVAHIASLQAVAFDVVIRMNAIKLQLFFV